MSPKLAFAFDEEQEFFVDLQGLEMYHTDVVEALNSLLAVMPELHEINMRATRHQRGTSEAAYLIRDLQAIEERCSKIFAALPENLK